jgi:hypothetical protein
VEAAARRSGITGRPVKAPREPRRTLRAGKRIILGE